MILISACLGGIPCRMDGASKPSTAVQKLIAEGRAVPICPEVMGGLPTPRIPSERLGERVVNRAGENVTAAFQRGAEAALRVCLETGCTAAILKAKSPSCGFGTIHNGLFDDGLTEGNGVLVDLLIRQGIPVMTEQDYDGSVLLRRIEARDNAAVAQLVRSSLIAFGATEEGSALSDPMLDCFSEFYVGEGRAYWVAESAAGEILGGVGIGELPGAAGVCELQKLYCIPSARGTGVAQLLMKNALAYAKAWYRACYLESFANMKAAHRFYEKHGFRRIAEPMGETGHSSCEVFYFKEL